MTSLDLGDKFDTSNVTDMSEMFRSTGFQVMTSLDLGDKFDTSNVTDMSEMFRATGFQVMTSLDLGDKFDTSNVTNMYQMFYQTGYTAMTSLDLGPAFIQIPDGNVEIEVMVDGIYQTETHLAYENTFGQTGKRGEIVIQAPESIYNDRTHFKLNTDSTTIIGWTDENGNEITTYGGTINPKYRTEWIKEEAEIDETNANNPKSPVSTAVFKY